MANPPLVVEWLGLLAVLGVASADVSLAEPTFVEACPSVVRDEPIQPIPISVELDARRVELGRRLFHDRRLSKDGTVACASCHVLANGGDDDRVRSVGIEGRSGAVNAPTVLNSVFNFRQFWDGRARDLREQVDGPLTHPDEMGSNWEYAVARIEEDPTLAAATRSLYGSVDARAIRDAIAGFETSLITPDAPFDRYLCGDDSAISDAARRGYAAFQGYGCISCHQGRNVGGNMYEKLGVAHDYFAARGHVEPADFGRFNVTGREEDRYVFRVPSLRNVDRTAPYFHDGSQKTLEAAIGTMARFQLGRDLPKGDLDDIAAFLRSLSGRLPEAAP